MINGIILDIDGVISGDKKGYNWPDPHPDVVHAIKSINARGITVSLCTGRGTFGIHHFVKLLELKNPHIGDGGAVIIDVYRDMILDSHPIDPKIVARLVDHLQQKNLYLELYTVQDYYIESGSEKDITEKHASVLGKKSIAVSSLSSLGTSDEVIKIMPIAGGAAQKKEVESIFRDYEDILTLQWGTHPSANPYEFGIITTKGISKGTAATKLMSLLDIRNEDVLGVGDSTTDWDFIKQCGFAGAMGNASTDLKRNVETKEHYRIGPDVDHNGLLDIFRHFELL
ncbi:HAD-IIB family hydrolase [Candidatus Woesebacteria bacterium]|nr:HAD-IIB family hydrolase [Candidatus Woesebacteria bacterium]